MVNGRIAIFLGASAACERTPTKMRMKEIVKINDKTVALVFMTLLI
jgi:hypothetical protein